MKEILLYLVFISLSITQLNSQTCQQRPKYKAGETGFYFTSTEGELERFYHPNGVPCAIGVFLENSSNLLTWSIKFPILTDAKRVKYYVEIYEALSSKDLGKISNYNLIATSPEVKIKNHYKSKEYYVGIKTPVKQNYTYRARVRWKKRVGGAFWKNNITSTWNVYTRKSGTCPFGTFDGIDCMIMNIPSKGFIYRNCFYVQPTKGNKCPDGFSYDSANCYLKKIPSRGFIYDNNFYVQPNADGSCPAGTKFDSANCVVKITPWGYKAFEYDGNWYVTPMPKCPNGYSFDGANCKFKCPPNGRKAYKYNGKWYYEYK